MSGTAGALTVAGSRTSGTPIRTQNVMAANAIANIVKSSLGPVGLDKMLVDDIGVSETSRLINCFLRIKIFMCFFGF